MRLLRVFADLRIDGDVVGFADEAGLHRYRVALGGYRKVARMQALTPDIAAGMDALSAAVTRLDGDRWIEIALLTRPYNERATSDVTFANPGEQRLARR